MPKHITRRAFAASTVSAIAALASAACASSNNTADDATTDAGTPSGNTTTPRKDAESHLSLSLEQKVAQLIMPAIRTWGGNSVTGLSAVPELAEALRRHQYGGVILFGQNIQDTKQTTTLVHELQANNAQSSDALNTGLIPYLVSVDQEGGAVARISMGTRGTGSMAIGASGEAAEDHAFQTGQVFGEELAALGMNVNLGPCVDVITDLTDPGMSTRVFSDDPDLVQRLGRSFANGVGESNVITCFKHFPGAGDGSDYPTAISLTLEELQEQGLSAYKALIETGADMVMVSATTFPAIDDEHVLADGQTTGYYPASMSPKIVGHMLREDLGFDGVVMTDALEMDQFFEEPVTGDKILPGEKYSVECAINIAQKCIEAGCDILLVPTDLSSQDAATWFDDYIAGIVALVQDGVLAEERIDKSVERILDVKRKYGIMDLEPLESSLDDAVSAAAAVVGSEAHHEVERAIAEKAVTQLKDDDTLPLPLSDTSLVIIGRTAIDSNPIVYALSELMQVGTLDVDALIDNRLAGTTSGHAGEGTSIIIDCYYDWESGTLAYSDELSAAVAKADYVVCLSAMSEGVSALQDSDPRVQGVTRALAEAHAAGAKFVLLSDNIPVDAARYPEADAIVCAYLSSGFDIDPTTNNGSENMRAINANVPAALRAIFGLASMPGQLPINIPELEQGADGVWTYTDKILYARGTGA